MTPTLIILALVALGAGIVFWATRKKPDRGYHERLDQDTAWNDPVGAEADAADDPFANAPPSSGSRLEETRRDDLRPHV